MYVESRRKLGGENSVVEPELGKCEVRVGVCVLVGDVRGQLIGQDAEESFIILPQHHHVRVIVPRDEALMSYRSE